MVLKSNDWDKYSPSMILVESIGDDMNSIMIEPIYLFLKEKGYKIVGKTFRTLVLEKENNITR